MGDKSTNLLLMMMHFTWGQGGRGSHRRLERKAVLGILEHVPSHLQLEHEVSKRIPSGDGRSLEGMPRERSQQPKHRRSHCLLHLLLRYALAKCTFSSQSKLYCTLWTRAWTYQQQTKGEHMTRVSNEEECTINTVRSHKRLCSPTGVLLGTGRQHVRGNDCNKPKLQTCTAVSHQAGTLCTAQVLTTAANCVHHVTNFLREIDTR